MNDGEANSGIDRAASKELGDYTAARHVLNALDFPCCTLLHGFLH